MNIGNNLPIYGAYDRNSGAFAQCCKHHPIPIEEPGGCIKDAVNMPGHRHRRADGRLVQKRGDTKVKNLMKKDHMVIPNRVPPDMTLKTLREITGKVGMHQVSLALRTLEKAGILDAMLLNHKK